jgi:hypothetical protein
VRVFHPLPTVQVGYRIGNICSQGSRWAIESSGISSIHMPHSNNRQADLASWARCAESVPSFLSKFVLQPHRIEDTIAA